jgi:DNA-binding response OmpR family regulator
MRNVWRFEWIADPSTVTVHVRRLRTKVERDPDHPEHLKTIWGAGYRWDP